jgi:hypothetical protein
MTKATCPACGDTEHRVDPGFLGKDAAMSHTCSACRTWCEVEWEGLEDWDKCWRAEATLVAVEAAP